MIVATKLLPGGPMRWRKLCRGGPKLFLVLLLTTASPLFARDRGQFANSSPEMKAWFDALKSGRGPCCSDADGMVVSDGDWDTKDGRYRVRLDGEWIECSQGAEPRRSSNGLVYAL